MPDMPAMPSAVGSAIEGAKTAASNAVSGASDAVSGAVGAGAAAAGAAAGAIPGAAGADLDEMARRLFDPLSARLRAELWLDRERAGSGARCPSVTRSSRD